MIKSNIDNTMYKVTMFKIKCYEDVKQALMKYSAGETALAVIEGMIQGQQMFLDKLAEAWLETHRCEKETIK